MKSHLVHELVHDEGCPCHISAVFHKGNEGIEDEYLWKENDNRTDTSDNAVYKHCLQRTVRHRVAYPAS